MARLAHYIRAEAFVCAVSLWALASGCALEASSRNPAVYVRHLPPTAMDVMEAAIRSRDIDRTVEPSCAGIGHWFDPTLGRQFAYLVEGLEPGKRGWVEVRTAPRRAPSGMY